MRSSAISHPGPTTNYGAYLLGRLWMHVFGWDVEGEPPQVPKAVLIAAPHTSNWDLAHMVAASYVFRLQISWLGKHTLFRPPFTWFMKGMLHGLPVDRSAPHGVVQQVVDLFDSADRLIIAVPPEGTRGKGKGWKSGFYWIAHTAKVPIVCGYLDYERKRAGLGYTIVPTGDIAVDMEKIRAFYANIPAKFPENKSEIRVKEEDAA